MTEETTEKSAGLDRAEYHSALAVGLAIGRYKIMSVLGEGGFGITYRCHDTQLHRDVAIKEYLPSGLAIRQGDTQVLPRSTEVSKDFVWGRSRFLDEARIIARLSNVPGVVRVHDFLEAHGTAYVVMQLLVGETLAQRLARETRLPQAAIDQILPPLLDGLEQIHAVGFLHRDVKPANIMLAPDGSPTLIDFGASRAAIADRSQAMTAIFTPHFAAPEQSSAGKQGPWTDIYGLAATLYACVCGKPPPSALERLLDGASDSAVEAAGQGYAPSVLAAIDVGMLLQASTRPQTIAAWRQVFATCVWTSAGAPQQAQHAPIAPSPQPTNAMAEPKAAEAISPPCQRSLRQKKRTVLVAAAALLFAGGAGYAIHAFRTPDALGPGVAPQIVVQPSATATAAHSAVTPAPVAMAGSTRSAGTQADGPGSAAEEASRQEAAAQRQAEEARLADEADARGRFQREQAAMKAAEEQQARAQVAAKADQEARGNAEPAEAELRLTIRDRQKLQVALTSLGFDVGGIDGAFGPRSREMIAAWQSKKSDPSTGFVTAAQNAALLSEGAPAIARWEEVQRRAFAEEQRRRQQQPQQPHRRSGWRWPWE